MKDRITINLEDIDLKSKVWYDYEDDSLDVITIENDNNIQEILLGKEM